MDITVEIRRTRSRESLGNLRAAMELALVVLAVLLRSARITLAGFLHFGRHSSVRKRDLPFSGGRYQCQTRLHISLSGSLRRGSPSRWSDESGP